MASMETTSEAPARTQPVSLLPTALIGVVALAVAIVFLWSSSWYVVFLTIHILFVVVWIGGGLLLTLFGILAERARDGAELAQIAKMAAFAGERVFAPSALIVLIMGVAMVLNADLGFDHFFIVFGLLGFLSTFVIGIAVLGPMAKRATAMIAERSPNDPEVQAYAGKILLVARVDVAVLLLVIIDMITRPFS